PLLACLPPSFGRRKFNRKSGSRGVRPQQTWAWGPYPPSRRHGSKRARPKAAAAPDQGGPSTMSVPVVSKNEVLKQFHRLQKTGFEHRLETAAAANGLPAPFVFAIASREA